MPKPLPCFIGFRVLSLVAWLLITRFGLAQPTPAPAPAPTFTARTCQCSEIDPNKTAGKGALSANEVGAVIEEILAQLPLSESDRNQLRGELRVVAVKCEKNARALSCAGTVKKGKSTQTGTIRYILYNDAFLDRIANDRAVNRKVSPTDYFILAHEVGHHYFNHIHPDEEGEPVTASARHDKELLIPYLEKEKPNHVDELEADAAAIGVMYKLKKSRNDILEPFRQMIRLRLDHVASSTHPSATDRLKFAERLLDRFARNKGTLTHQQARGFADEFYDEATQKRFEIMQERTFWTLLPGVEALAGIPVLRSASQASVPAIVTPGGGIMVQFSRKNWRSPHGYDLTLGASNQAFSTYTTLSGSRRTIEKFNVYWATLQPTYSFHSIGRRDSAFRDQVGWFVTVGGTLRLPVSTAYTNYATGEDNSSNARLQLTVNPTIRAGFEKWTTHLPFERRRGTFQLYLSYSPIWLRFQSQPGVSALIHQVGIGVLYGF